MPLRLLCLHGWGTNQKILQSQLSMQSPALVERHQTLIKQVGSCMSSNAIIPRPSLSSKVTSIQPRAPESPVIMTVRTTATTVSHAPFSHEDMDESDILEAYEQLSETVALEGPFDGVLGFSHGGTLAAGFMIHHAKMNPNEPALFRCAIFINSLPPFRMELGQRPVVEEGLEGFISIPCVHIAGAKDPLFEYSMALYRLCSARYSTFAVHGKGHDVPSDRKNVAIIATAIRKLSSQIL
ncbi:hypothetical protein N7497_005400 [Penicillium chrysogenum]|nr:hypothetical protein N7497_005400 [Penicillium chrysogenum]